MEANELRINNYVNAHLYDEMPILVESVCRHEENIYNSWTGEISLHSLTGIKITEDWLLNFGFFDTGVALEIQIDLDNGSTFYGYESEDGFCIGVKDLLLNLKYIHELQNLYFAITKKELNLINN